MIFKMYILHLYYCKEYQETAVSSNVFRSLYRQEEYHNTSMHRVAPMYCPTLCAYDYLLCASHFVVLL